MLQWIRDQVAKGKSSFLKNAMGALDAKSIGDAFWQWGFAERQRIYHTEPLLQTFLAQVVCGGSCREAVVRGIAQGWLPNGASPRTAAYCNARTRLPEEPLQALAFDAGHRLACATPESARFLDRPVRVVDGTGVVLPDTAASQREYPQAGNQKRGCGFPDLRVVALMDLDSGAILDAETHDRFETERRAFRELWRSLKMGDIVLGDAGYGSFAEWVDLQRRGIDGVFATNDKRFTRAKRRRLGSGEWRVTLPRPTGARHRLGRDDLPETIDVRWICFKTKSGRGRKKAIHLITTLTDRKRYPRKRLIRLYPRRWEMELRLRDIKTTMGLERLSAKTPEGCRKELWMGLLGYNLIRAVMGAAARRTGTSVARISFAGTMQRLRTFAQAKTDVWDDPWQALLEQIGADRLPRRPGRVEPRKVKRRPKSYHLLTRPRQLEQQQLLAC